MNLLQTIKKSASDTSASQDGLSSFHLPNPAMEIRTSFHCKKIK